MSKTKKQEPVKPVEPQSDSEEDSSSDEFETDSEQELEPTQTPVQNKPPPQAPSEEEESETESESESESDSAVKPLAYVQKSRSTIAKPDDSALTSPAAKPVSAKRPAAEDATATPSAKKKKIVEAKKIVEDATATPSAKKKKVVEASEKKKKIIEDATATPSAKKKMIVEASKKIVEAAETSEKKPPLFQRLWSEDDEIGILEGMIEYRNKKKTDPMADLSAFQEYIKNTFNFDFAEFTRVQLQDKIRRLKKKFENNKKKEKVGKEKNFSNPNEQKSYHLSKLIWGSEKVVGNGSVASSSRKTPKKVNSVETESEEEDEVKVAAVTETETGEGSNNKATAALRKLRKNLNASLSLGENMMSRLERDSQWEKLRREELNLFIMELEIKIRQTEILMDLVNVNQQ